MVDGQYVLPDPAEWVRFWTVLAGILLAIGVAEALRKLGRFHPEFSRKSVHIGVGAGILFAPRLFISPIPILLLAALFALINLYAIRRGWLKAIHSQRRRSFGTVYFPASLFVLTLLFWQRSPELVALSMFAFSLGDAGAALVGESVARPSVFRLTKDAKSFQGSIAMFLLSQWATVGGAWFLWSPIVPSWYFLIAMGSAVAIVSTATEALSSNGLDNLTVPCANALVLSVFLFPSAMAPVDQLLMGISLALFIALLSHELRVLTPGGSVATFLLATVVFGLGGWKWTMPMLSFFVFSSLLSLYGRKAKAEVAAEFEKSSIRDHAQVAANGGIGGLLLLFEYAFPGVDLYPAFIGSLAAVTADTWGTETGILSRGTTVSLVTFKDVPAGTSGGVSLAGTLSGCAGALFISGIGAQWTGSTTILFAGCIGGIVGSVADSLVGETLQARFRCAVCGRETEREVHCDQPAEYSRGFRPLRNDGVNVVCAVVGAAVAFAIATA